jgi:hypothetical protein
MSALDIRRRLFLGGSVGVLALRPPRAAQADTSFSKFGFAATGAPTARTMPDRLNDLINIKDWGAKGDGPNDAPAIQAAIDYCISRGGGKVFFPEGAYVLSSPLIVGSNSSSTIGVQLIGNGKYGSKLIPHRSYSDPNNYRMISKGNKIYDCIERVDGLSIYYGLKLTREKVIVLGCEGSVDASNALGAYIQCCSVLGGHGRADDPNHGVASPLGIAYAVGTNGTIVGCRGHNYTVYYALSGDGASCIGSSVEGSDCAVRIGWAPSFSLQTSTTAGSGTNVLSFSSLLSGVIVGRYISGPNIPANTYITAVDTTNNTITISNNITGSAPSGTRITFENETPARGCIVTGLQTERCTVGIDLYNATGCLITGNFISGTVGLPDEAPIAHMSWAGGTLTVTTPTAHNIPVGTQLIQLASGVPTAWIPDATKPGTGDSSTLCQATVTMGDTTHFTYPGVSANPGAHPGTIPHGWDWPLESAIKCRKMHNCAVIGNNVGQFNPSVATIDLNYGGTSELTYNVFAGLDPSQGGWKLPADKNKAGLIYTDAISGFISYAYLTSNSPNPLAQMVFANLPGQAGVLQPGPFEGQEYNITDGQKESGGTALFADAVQGSGGQHIKVRYDGTTSKWRRMG